MNKVVNYRWLTKKIMYEIERVLEEITRVDIAGEIKRVMFNLLKSARM